MEWISGRRLGATVRLLVYLVLVSSEESKYVSYSSMHLDAALHHYDTLHVDDISHTPSVNTDSESRQVLFNALGRNFHMVLDRDTHIFAEDFAVYSVDSAGETTLHDLDQKAFLHGHLKDEKSSMVTAHLSNQGILSAVIVTPNHTYHVEPSHHYIREPHPFHMVAYAGSHVKNRLHSTRFDYVVPPVVPTFSHGDQQTFSKDHGSVSHTGAAAGRVRRQTVDRGRIADDSCNMILIADHTAFELFQSDVQSASSQLVLLVSSVDRMIYRQTEWLVDINDNVVGNLGHTIERILVHQSPSNDDTDYYFDNPNFSAGDILGLMRFGPWRDFCLAHLFTNRNFASGLLGLANIASPLSGQTGGICSREFADFSVEPSRSLIFNTGLSTYNNNGQRMILSEMIRVIGHELGHNWGSHHDPGTSGCGNSFLMNEFAQDGSLESHTMFSECSRRSIGEVLLNKGFCFGSTRTAECGNYQVEGEEGCDVGPEGDDCCSTGCTLTEGSVCSDRNALCCSGCQIADSSTVCRRGLPLSASCTTDTLCNGVATTCPSTPQPATNGSQCIQGICMFRENSDTVTECVPLCEVHGMGALCSCDGEDECRVCCNSTGSCTPLPGSIPLSDQSLCSRGVCINGSCESRVQDQVARIWDIITSLNASAFRIFVEENIVGFTLIFSIPIWCLGSCLIHWLVDYRRIREFERSVKKEDIGRLFLRKPTVRNVGRTVRDGSSDRKPLLGTIPELDKELDQPVDEPVDDLPLPVSTRISM